MRKVQIIRFLVVAVIIIINFILQPIIFRNLAFNGIVPNVFIITIVSFGVLRGRIEGAVIGMIIGLLQDIYYGDVVGFYAIIYMHIGFFSGFLYRNFYRNSLIVPIATIAIADLYQNIVVFFFTFLFRSKFQFNTYLIQIIIPEVIYTLFVGFILYHIYYIINLYIERKEWLKENEY